MQWRFENASLVEKASFLDGVSEDIDAKQAFVKVSSKKNASPTEFNEASLKCADRNIPVPSTYAKKHVESQFNAQVENQKFDEASKTVFDAADCAPEQLVEIVSGIILTKAGLLQNTTAQTGPTVRASISRRLNFVVVSFSHVTSHLRCRLVVVAHVCVVPLAPSQVGKTKPQKHAQSKEIKALQTHMGGMCAVFKQELDQRRAPAETKRQPWQGSCIV